MSETAPTPSHDPYAAIRIPDYRLFAAASFLSVIGGQILSVTALFEVYRKTHSEMSLGWVGAFMALPMLLLALPAGHWADHHSRRRTGFVTQIGSAGCILVLACVSYFWSDWGHSVAAIYALLALNNAFGTFGRPARTALLPQLLPGEAFSNGVAWNTSLFETASMIGPVIGGLLCAWHIPASYALAALLSMVAAALVFFLPEKPIQQRGSARPGFADLVAGVRFVFRTRLMLGAMTLDMFAVLLGGAKYVFPAMADKVLHVGARELGWMNTAPAVGAFIMAVLQAHRPPWRHAGRALLFSVAGFGAATVAFGLSHSLTLSLIMLAFTGVFDNVSVVIRHTLIQLLTPDSMRGRVSAVNQIFIGSSNEIGGWESGVTAALFGLVPSVILGGAGTLLVVVMVTAFFPELRRLGSLRDIKPIELPTTLVDPEANVAVVTK